MALPGAASTLVDYCRPRFLTFSMLVALTAPLFSCRSGVDEVRVKIDQSERGVVIALLSGSLAESELGDVSNSTAYKELEGISQRLGSCEISRRLYTRSETVRLDLRAEFSDVDDANSKLNCGGREWEQPRVEFTRNEGFLSDDYITRFSISRRISRCNADTCSRAFASLPRTLILTVPGAVRDTSDRSDLLGGRTRAERVDDDTVQVSITRAANYEAINQAHFTGGRTERIDRVDVQVTSRQVHYDLDTIISIFGALLGSGIVIELLRRSARRRSTESSSRGR